MITTLVAMLCSTLVGPPLCVEEIITDQLSWQECQIHGQLGIIEYMENSPRYRHDWKVESYKCAPGTYVLKDKI